MAQVYCLTGSSLEAEQANINGVTIDALDVDDSLVAITPRETAEHPTPPVDRYDIQVDVDVDQRRPINPLYFGFNLEAHCIRGGWTSDLIDINAPHFTNWVKALRPGLVRYPGGSHNVYWDRSNRADRFDAPGGYGKVLRADDLDELLEFCEMVGAELYINVNIGRNDFDMWADFAAYAGDRVRYLSGGNEPNINGISPTEYVTRLQGYRAAMGDRFAWGAPEVTKRAIDDPAYTRNVLSQVDGLGLVTGHAYQLWGKDPNNASPTYPTISNLLAGSDSYDARIGTLSGLRDQYQSEGMVAMTEFGPCLGLGDNSTPITRRVFNSLATALWVADVLGRGARAGADAMLYYYLTLPDYRSTWGFPSMLFHNDLGTVYPVAYTYLMFGQWWGDEWVLDVHSSDEAQVSVNASVDGGNVYVMLINKTLDILNVLIEVAGRFIPYDLLPHSVTTFVMDGGETVGVINDLTQRVLALRDEAALVVAQAQARSDVLNAEADEISATITDLSDVAVKARQVADELVVDLGE